VLVIQWCYNVLFVMAKCTSAVCCYCDWREETDYASTCLVTSPSVYKGLGSCVCCSSISKFSIIKFYQPLDAIICIILLFIIFSGSAAQRGLWPRFRDHTQRRAIVGRTPLDE
jgi:hypothetical protein